MTIDELIEKLAQYPGYWKVVVNNSSDYEDYCVASDVSPGEHRYGHCGGTFKHRDGGYLEEVNSVLIS